MHSFCKILADKKHKAFGKSLAITDQGNKDKLIFLSRYKYSKLTTKTNV